MKVEWRQDDVYLGIYIDNKFQFNIYLGEAMEQLPRYRIMEIVKSCDKTPWLRNWHKEKHDKL